MILETSYKPKLLYKNKSASKKQAYDASEFVVKLPE